MSEEKTVVRTVPASGFALKGIRGEHKDKVYPINTPFTVGRGQENNLVINEGFVSRCHAQLKSMSAGVLITDNQSSNGTYINNKPIETTLTAHCGDIIKFDVVDFELVEYVKSTEEPGIAQHETNIRLDTVRDIDEPLQEQQMPNTAERLNVQTSVNIGDQKTVVADINELAVSKPVQDDQKTVFACVDDIKKSVTPPSNNIDSDNQKTVVASAEVLGKQETAAVSRQDDKKTIIEEPKPLEPASHGATASAGESQRRVTSTVSSDSVVGMRTEAIAKIARAASQPVELLGLTAPVSNRTFKLSKKRLSIGRSPFNDIIFKSPSVSSQHAEIEYINNHWLVRDLGSSNGTYVNDELIEQSELYHNDSLIFGEVELTFDPKGLVPAPRVTSEQKDELAATSSSITRWLLIAVLLALGVVAGLLIK